MLLRRAFTTYRSHVPTTERQVAIWFKCVGFFGGGTFGVLYGGYSAHTHENVYQRGLACGMIGSVIGALFPVGVPLAVVTTPAWYLISRRKRVLEQQSDSACEPAK